MAGTSLSLDRSLRCWGAPPVLFDCIVYEFCTKVSCERSRRREQEVFSMKSTYGGCQAPRAAAAGHSGVGLWMEWMDGGREEDSKGEELAVVESRVPTPRQHDCEKKSLN